MDAPSFPATVYVNVGINSTVCSSYCAVGKDRRKTKTTRTTQHSSGRPRMRSSLRPSLSSWCPRCGATAVASDGGGGGVQIRDSCCLPHGRPSLSVCLPHVVEPASGKSRAPHPFQDFGALPPHPSPMPMPPRPTLILALNPSHRRARSSNRFCS